MPARKAAPEEPTPYQTGLSGKDFQMPRMRVVGRQAKLVEAGVAKPGNIAIGADAEDAESVLFDALNGKEPVRFYVLKVHPNYATKFGGTPGVWEEGDPEMPDDAQRQYNYTMYVPAISDVIPVIYTASSTAAGEGKRKVNTRIGVDAVEGKPPYTRAFEMTTKINTRGQNSWPGPVIVLVEPVASEVAIAKEMHDSIVGPPRQSIGTGDVADKPAL